MLLIFFLLRTTAGAIVPAPDGRLSNIVRVNTNYNGQYICCVESNRSWDWVNTCVSYGLNWAYRDTVGCADVGATVCQEGPSFNFCCNDQAFINSFVFTPLQEKCKSTNRVYASYNVTDYSSITGYKWSEPSDIVALGIGTNVRSKVRSFKQPDGSETTVPYMVRNEGGNSYVTSMWGGLAWANDTIYTQMGGPKRHIEISWLEVAELPDFPQPMRKLMWDPEQLAFKLGKMMGGSNPEYYWSGFVTDNLMGTRNVHSSDTPATFAYGSNYPSSATKVSLASFLGVGVILSQSVLEFNQQYADRKYYPYAVQRELNQLEVARSYVPFMTQILGIQSFVGHFCGKFPGPLMRSEMAKLSGEAGLTFHSTMYTAPLPLHESATPMLDSIYPKWRSSNIHVMMFGGCLASRIYSEMWLAKMSLPSPGKFWFGDWQKLNFADMIGSSTANDWEDAGCLVERDTLAGWVYHDALYKPVSYDKFCRWFTPLATPATLPWTATWVSTTMVDWYYLNDWTAKKWGPGVESGYTPYRNGICSGRSEAELQFVSNYPYGSHYDHYDEMMFFWAQNLDSMWQTLWGHETATRKLGNSYGVSDWLTATESAPGYGFFQDFNPGAQNEIAHQNVWVQYTRAACSMWWNFNAEIISEVLAEYRKDASGSSFIRSLAATRPTFCMPSIPPSTKLECAQGSYYDDFWGQCLQCKAGKFAGLQGMTACKLCSPGTFGTVDGATKCELCPAGHVNALTGAIACAKCPGGTFAQKPGRIFCADCHPGRYQNLSGQSQCLSCSVGTFTPESKSTACNSCSKGSTTGKLNSVFERECICQPGHYNKLLNSIEAFPMNCKKCTENLPQGDMWICNGSQSASPIYVKPGYMSVAGSTTIYKCAGTGKACPFTSELGGGQACPPNSKGIACSHCVNDFRWDHVEKKCVECNERSIAFYVACGIIFLALIYLMIPRAGGIDTVDQLFSCYMFTANGVPLAQAVDLFLYGAMLGYSTIPWPERTREFLQRFASLLDVSFFYLDCKMHDDREDQAMAYVIWTNMTPLIFVVVVLALCLPSICLPGLRVPSLIYGINIIFSATSTFFMGIVHLAFTPSFQNYEHPALTGQGSEASLTFFPFLLVGGSRTDDLRVFSLIMLGVYVLFFFLIPVFLIFRLPSKRYSQSSLKYYTVSLVAKYRDTMAWWHAFELIFKGAAVFAVSAWHDPTWQYRALVFLLVIQGFLFLMLEPFRLYQHNIGEESAILVKMFVLATALPSFEGNLESDGRVVFIFAFGFAWLGLGLVHAAYRIINEEFMVAPPLPIWDPSEGHDAQILITKDEESEALQLAAAEAAAEVPETEKEKVGQMALMSLRFKHASVLWTLAAHYTKNRAGHIECRVLKEFQQKIIVRLKEGIDLRDLQLMLDLNEQLFENVKRAT